MAPSAAAGRRRPWLAASAAAAASCGRGARGQTWVLGSEGRHCDSTCDDYGALCDEGAAWPASEAALRSIVDAVNARQQWLHSLATTEQRDFGTSAWLQSAPPALCAAAGGAPPADWHPSSGSPTGPCGWQPQAAAPARRCSVGPPPPARRFCPCRPRATGTDDGGPCQSQSLCLDIVDRFLDEQPRAFGLLQVRAGEGSLGGGPCGGLCTLPGPCPEGDAKCRHDTYDSAIAAIYYTKRGRLEAAKNILDAFLRILYPASAQQLRPHTEETLHRDGPSKRVLTLLASSYNNAQEPQAGNYEAPWVTDGGVDAGNNAWVALAFAHYAAATGAACYATVAHDILTALASGACGDQLGGYLGHLAPYKANYRSTEHNIDIFALAKILGRVEEKHNAHHFVHSMFGASPEDLYNGTYATGTGAEHPCDYSIPKGAPVAADATFWSVLADADPNETRINEALRFALLTPGVDASGHMSPAGLWAEDLDLVWTGTGPPPRLNGTRFSTWGSGVQWENTAGAAMAMAHYQAVYGTGEELQIPRFLRESRDSLRRLLGMYGGVPASVRGGNYGAWQSGERRSLFPGGSDTGLGWPYLRYLSTAPTVWAGLMLLHNPGDSGQVDETANPYAMPARAVPAAADSTCIRGGMPDALLM